MYNNGNNILLGRRKNNHIIPLNDPKRKLVGRTILFTNARDENNIKEWVAHHLLIGFDLIYIFDHKSKKPISDELKNFKKGVVVERCEMDGPIKMQLMMKASKIATASGADWMLYLDADEFLILNAFNHVKTFVRPSQVEDAITPHYFVLSNPQRMVSINMKPMSNTKSFNEWDIEYTKCPAFIAHYVYQSEESYIKRKINLPRDDNSLYRKIESNIHAKHNSTVNELVKTKYADPINKILNI